MTNPNPNPNPNPFLSRRVDPRLAALILGAVAVAAVIVISIAVVRSNSTTPSTRTAPAGTTPAAAVSSSSPSGVVPQMPTSDGLSTPDQAGDDTDDDPSPTAAPSGNPASLAAAKTAALRFAAAWLNTTNKSAPQWRADLAPLATAELNQMLANADPATVPAGQIGDPITVAANGTHLAIVTVPVIKAGTLTLTVTTDTRPLLVTDVDWTAAP